MSSMEELASSVESYKRVTQNLLNNLCKFENYVVAVCRNMNDFPSLTGYQVQDRGSNIGAWWGLFDVSENIRTYLPERVADINRSFFVHGQYQYGACYMNRSEILKFASHARTILQELKKYIEAKQTEYANTTTDLAKITNALSE